MSAPTQFTLQLEDATATQDLGRRIGSRMAPGQAIGLVGEVGAGKTCFARGVGQGLALRDPSAVCSPTYLLLIEHVGPLPMLHVDAYLPEKTRDFLADGGVDYLAEAKGVVVVEWADRIADLLPALTLWVHLRPIASGSGREAVLEDRTGGVFAWVADLLGENDVKIY